MRAWLSNVRILPFLGPKKQCRHFFFCQGRVPGYVHLYLYIELKKKILDLDLLIFVHLHMFFRHITCKRSPNAQVFTIIRTYHRKWHTSLRKHLPWLAPAHLFYWWCCRFLNACMLDSHRFWPRFHFHDHCWVQQGTHMQSPVAPDARHAARTFTLPRYRVLMYSCKFQLPSTMVHLPPSWPSASTPCVIGLPPQENFRPKQSTCLGEKEFTHVGHPGLGGYWPHPKPLVQGKVVWLRWKLLLIGGGAKQCAAHRSSGVELWRWFASQELLRRSHYNGTLNPTKNWMFWA